MSSSSPNYLVFDFETNGLDGVNDAIMQMSVLDGHDGSVILNEYVWPWNNEYSESAFAVHGIDRAVLIRENALTLRQLLTKVIDISRSRFGRERVVWVAYNCFGFDQLFFESAFKHVNMRMPVNWWFMDLYPFIYNQFKIKKGFLKLEEVHKLLCGETTKLDLDNIQMHNSLADTQCLYELFEYCVRVFGWERLEASCIRPRTDSACIFEQPCSILHGYAWGMKLGERCGIWTIGDMYSVFCELDCDTKAFQKHMHDVWGVWHGERLYYMAKQLAKIHYGFRYDKTKRPHPCDYAVNASSYLTPTEIVAVNALLSLKDVV